MHPRLQAFLVRHRLSTAAGEELEFLADALARERIRTLWGETLAAASDSAPEAAPLLPASAQDRYRLEHLLGKGGSASVWRAWDHLLQRWTALKILTDPSATALARFREEALTTGTIEHPGIVAVHDFGQLADGRWYLAMAEVRGRTLEALIDAAHPGADDPTLRRLVRQTLRAAEALAHAHAEGFVHRDVKPSNIVVGRFGDVVLIDWGLARRAGSPPEGEPVGTPAYVAPEQARGDVAPDPRADVWSLGGILYSVLTGRRPREGDGRPATLARAAAHDARLPVDGLPAGLAELVERATALAPADRPAHAGEVVAALADWLDGADRAERARRRIEEAEDFHRQALAARAEAERLDGLAREARAAVPDHAPVDAKRPAWALEDAAREAADAARRAEVEREARLHGALSEAPGDPAALDALARLYQERQADAERRGDTRAAARNAQRLAVYDRGGFAAWRRGEGALTLHTDPPGATVEFFRYEERDRRRVPVPFGTARTTPVDAVPLPMGSYRLRVSASGYHPLVVPVHIGRLEHWDGVPPGERHPRPLPLLRLGVLDVDDVAVPAGWCRLGSPDAMQALPPARVWVEGFVIRRHPVTHADWLAFLNYLGRHGEPERAWAHVPRATGPNAAIPGAPAYGFDPERGFHLVPDADGDRWDPRWPVFLINAVDAEAYARWYGERRGAAWRLPGEQEWEKAGRGADGREYPWGDHPEPTWCNVRTSTPHPHPAPVDAFPEDESPYGVRGLAGNVREWCRDRFGPPLGGQEVPQRVLKGGAWFFTMGGARLATRYGLGERSRADTIGVRLARDWPSP